MRTKPVTIAVLFLTITVVTVLRPFTPFVNYYLNKGKIADEMCINKGIPASTCEGKCYLKKEVISAQKDLDQVESSVKLELDKYLCGNSSFFFDGHVLLKFRDVVSETTATFELLSGAYAVALPPPK